MKDFTNRSTFLLTSSENKKNGTAFCIYSDVKGSYLLTSAYAVEECGKDNLLIHGEEVKLLHCGNQNTIDLAILFIEKVKMKVLNLIDVQIDNNTLFEVNGFRVHMNQNYKLESLNGSVNKYSKLYSNDKAIDRYELTIDSDDEIEQGYSGSAIICSKTKYVFAVTTMSMHRNHIEAIPIKYLNDIWVDIPTKLLKSIVKNTMTYKKLVKVKKEWWVIKLIKYILKKIFSLMKYFILFVVILIIFVYVVILQDIDKAYEFNKKGEDAYQLKDFEGAVSYYNQAIIMSHQQAYSTPIIFANLAEVYYDLGYYNQSVSNADKAIIAANNKEDGPYKEDKDKAEGKAYYILGRMKEDKTKWNEALENYQIALKKKNELLYKDAISRMEKRLLKK